MPCEFDSLPAQLRRETSNPDFSGRHFGVVCFSNEVDLDRADVSMPGKLTGFMHLRVIANRIVDPGLAKRVGDGRPAPTATLELLLGAGWGESPTSFVRSAERTCTLGGVVIGRD